MINQPQVRRLVIGLQSVVKMHILTRSTGYKLVVFPAMSVVRSLSLSAVSLAAICMIVHLPTQAGLLSDEDIKRRADAVVGLMSFTLTPDVTTGSLSLSNEPTGNPDLALTTLGGGFTMSRDFPLYLEGTAGYSRYDPAFVFSDGEVNRPVPVKWNSLALTGGVGWDFPVAEELTFRPIFNFSYGRIKSDSSIAGDLLEDQTGADLEFLNAGTLEVFGLGGTLMLDYERYRDENEIDVELRYSNIRLQSFSDAPEAVQGSSNAQSLSLWTRWRAPTGLTALNRPMRYVLEAAHTIYIGDMRGALGFDSLNSLGVGLELDSSDKDIIVTRTRLVFRYKFGDNVEGTSVGLAVSF